MHLKARLILLFYRSWAFAGLLMTGVCGWLTAKIGLMMLPVALFFKAAVSALIWYMMREFGARKIYYFTNLGMSPRLLWRWAMAVDLMIFVICMTAAVIYNVLWTA